MKKQLAPLLGVFLSAATFAQTPEPAHLSNDRLTHVPSWAQNAIWYQIFVERFRNGDPKNDPTPDNIKDYINRDVPPGWKVTPWTQDWYKQDSWMANFSDPKTSFTSKVQSRRYGGDLQGVLEKLDYLKELGINAIFFNPLNDAPSLHKYDAAYWHHIDRNFGPTPQKDGEMMNFESYDNPQDWVWTNADKMFLKVIEEAHKRGIRVIMDYSWNHTGTNFWAFQDLLRKGKNSRYKDWYIVNRFDNPSTPENEFAYQGWFDSKSLPEIRETTHQSNAALKAYEGNIYSNEVKQHIFAIVKRWGDPNNDGNPQDGIDGMRLDVAAELPLGFWREFREVTRNVNPEMYLVGEVWWEAWPDKLLDPRPFLKGDVFDANMNYRWFRTARHLFDDAPNKMPIKEFVSQMDTIFKTVRPEVARGYMNMASSHDSPRLSTALYNKGLYKFNAKPFDDSAYKVNKPDAATYKVMKQLLIHQYTFLGAPQIWNGDEMGMWGSDDPDTRKPLIWPDYKFDDEVVHPLGIARSVDKVAFDSTLFNFYRQLISMRKNNEVLAKGSIKYLVTDEVNRILAYSRNLDKSEAIVAFNLSSKPKTITVPARFTSYANALKKGSYVKPIKGKLAVTINPKESVVLMSK